MKASPNTYAGILLGMLVVVSIRPIPIVDRVLNGLMSPASLVAALVSPLGWIRSGSYAEVNEQLQGLQQADEALGLDLRAELEAEAIPVTRSLREGRQFVLGRVGYRKDNDKDTLYLDVNDPTGIEPGFPVVHGEAFVGRVVEVNWSTGRVEVELVTGADFFVGATVLGDPRSQVAGTDLDLIVGGLDRVEGGPERLAVHNPSERRFRHGLVSVKEPNLFEGDALHLADGFMLGSLTALQGEDGPWSVEPLRNFESGLFHLVVVLPEDVEREKPLERPGSLRDGNWLGAKLLSHGDPEVGRAGFVIGLGSFDGVEPGAAVISSSRLVGRVDKAHASSPWTSRVLRLSEPGFTINAVARIVEGERRGESKVLGSLVSLGAGPDGVVTFQWNATVRLDGILNWSDKTEESSDTAEEQSDTAQEPPSVQAVLYTGTGLVGVPGGLYIGRAWLPLGVGRHDIRVTDTTSRAMPSRLFVRINGQSGGVSGE